MHPQANFFALKKSSGCRQFCVMLPHVFSPVYVASNLTRNKGRGVYLRPYVPLPVTTHCETILIP